MPFITIESHIPNTSLGLWKIEEDEYYFLERVKLYDNEWVQLGKVIHPKKRLEWLSSRLCLKHLLDIKDTSRIESLRMDSGKPYLSNQSYNISYSHSLEYSAAIASQAHEVGVDIEYLKRKRNIRTRFLFMDDEELDWFEENPTFENFILIWSAKESLYKIVGRGFGFKEHIHIRPNSSQLECNGILPAYVKTSEYYQEFQVHFEVREEVALTYTYLPQLQQVESPNAIVALSGN